VSDIRDPKKDGNCGFRCLALSMYGDEDEYGRVKEEMLTQLVEKQSTYLTCKWITEDELAKMNRVLVHRGPCGVALWFEDPVMSQLAADTFIQPVEYHGPQGSTLYLPLIKHTKNN
ncbi:hypothetical protein BC941DRAFT_319910, partial [Chlamydoabsidia padenii]